MKKILLATALILSANAHAADLYCAGKYLRDLRTGSTVRIFTYDSDEDRHYIDADCKTTLKASVNGVYCTGKYLKDLRTGEILRTFAYEPEDNRHYVDADCVTTLNATLNP